MKRIDQNRIAIQDKSRPDRNRFAEVRLSRDKVRIGEIANIRVWFRPPDREDYLPTRTGISIPIENVVDLVAALGELFPEAFAEFLVGDYEGADEDGSVQTADAPPEEPERHSVERSRSSPDPTLDDLRYNPTLGAWMEDKS